MGGGRLEGQGIEAGPVNLKDLGIQGTGEVAQVHALALGLHFLRSKEGSQGLEIVRVTAQMAVHLRFSQNGGHIAAVQRQGFLVARQSQGVLVVCKIVVSQHGQDGGYGVLLVELFQEGGTLVLLAHGCVHVVAGADDFFRRTALLLHLIESGQSLLVLLILEIEVQELVIGAVVIRKIPGHSLI